MAKGHMEDNHHRERGKGVKGTCQLRKNPQRKKVAPKQRKRSKSLEASEKWGPPGDPTSD